MTYYSSGITLDPQGHLLGLPHMGKTHWYSYKLNRVPTSVHTLPSHKHLGNHPEDWFPSITNRIVTMILAGGFGTPRTGRNGAHCIPGCGQRHIGRPVMPISIDWGVVECVVVTENGVMPAVLRNLTGNHSFSIWRSIACFSWPR